MKLIQKDIAVMIAVPILATLITLTFQTNLLTSILMFFGVPCVYLTYRNPGIFKKSFAFAFLLSITLSAFIDAFAAVNGSWVVPESLFPFKILGVATVEVYIYGLLWVLYAVLFYEHFFDKGKKKDKISPHVKYLIGISVVLVAYALIAFFVNTDLLYIPYFYLLCGIVLVIIPLVLFLAKYPKFIPRYAFTAVYFFLVLFLFEIAALYVGQWIFPAQDFIGFVNVFGFSFPFEELIIWMVAATAACLSYYEFFADDHLISK
jgi:hypothetical protein